MINYFTVPGFGGSGANHWQTWLEITQQNVRRIEQSDWNAPDIDRWVENVDKILSGYNPSTVVLIAHSLGCHTVAEWARRTGKQLRGAMLVAPPDIDVVRNGLRVLQHENPLVSLPFQTVVVASTNDPWADIKTAENYSKIWGSRFVNIGDAGHINADSGHFEWQQGVELLLSI